MVGWEEGSCRGRSSGNGPALLAPPAAGEEAGAFLWGGGANGDEMKLEWVQTLVSRSKESVSTYGHAYVLNSENITTNDVLVFYDCIANEHKPCCSRCGVPLSPMGQECGYGLGGCSVLGLSRLKSRGRPGCDFHGRLRVLLENPSGLLAELISLWKYDRSQFLCLVLAGDNAQLLEATCCFLLHNLHV